MGIYIKQSDFQSLCEYMEWTIDNPSPCMKCYSYGKPECCGCIQDGDYREKKSSLPGSSVYNNMNYQKLADVYGRRYIAAKVKEEAIKNYNKEASVYESVLQEYDVVCEETTK